MMGEQVLPRLEADCRGEGVVRSRILRSFGMGESTLDDELKEVATSADVSLGFRTSFPDNLLRPLVHADSVERAEAMLDLVCAEIRERLGVLVYGEGDETLEKVVGRLLGEHDKTIAVAESCTGGLIAERISRVPGASEYFCGGVVAYANAAKSELLGVSQSTLIEHGAVSDPVVREMAEGVRERFGADVGIATTGISGPGGGSESKPVGLVWLALALEGETHSESFVFSLDRLRHRQLTAQVALDWVRRALLGVELVGPNLMRKRASVIQESSGGNA